MNRHTACVALTVLLAVCPLVGIAAANPANRTPFRLVQPDGTTFQARTVGDEWAHATETLDGYTILRDPASGNWVYANKVAGGPLTATTLVVGRNAPAGLPRGLRPERAQFAPSVMTASPSFAPVFGSRKTLVLLVQFADKTGSTTASAWQTKFFGATNSVKDHYTVSSYGQVTIDAATESHGTANDGIVGWLSLPGNHPNTQGSNGTGDQQLAKDAIIAADPYVNFASYDTSGNGRITPDELMVIVIAAGNETAYGGPAGSCSPSVWGHKWSVFLVTPPTLDGKLVGADGYAMFGEMHCGISNPPGLMATIGIMAHEVGHLGFGLPDLYDTDGSSRGIGDWSLMAGGSWNGVSRSGDSPSLLDAWSRAFLGWVTPTAVTSTPTLQNIPAAETNSTVFQFLAGTAGTGTSQYFLLENRQKTSYDVALPGSGLLIWHIDEARSTNAAECIPGGAPACTATVHYKVAVIQADNLFHLEHDLNDGDTGDPFPGSGAKTQFTNLTSPNANLWNGTASNVSVTNISASASVMTATLSLNAVVTLNPGWFDFNADGKSDVIWRHNTLGEVWLWPMNGAVHTAETFIRRVADTNWEIRGLGDQNGDGKPDILWRNKITGGLVFWPMNGSTPQSETFITSVDPAYDIVGTGDYNGDSKSDILWRHGTNGQVWIWLMNGAATLSIVHVDTIDPIYTIVGSGDLNADGKADIVWRNTSTGEVWVWLMNGTTRLSQTMVGSVPDLGYQIVGVADYTGDGKADILWRHTTLGQTWLWPMNGAAIVSQSFIATVDPIYVIVGTGDYNGDGKADILWHRSNTGDVWVWLMNGAVKLSETYSGTVPDLGYQIVKVK